MLEVPLATPAGTLPDGLGSWMALMRMCWHAQGVSCALAPVAHAMPRCRLCSEQQREQRRAGQCGCKTRLLLRGRPRPSTGWISAARARCCGCRQAAGRRAQPLLRPCTGGQSLGSAGLSAGQNGHPEGPWCAGVPAWVGHGLGRRREPGAGACVHVLTPVVLAMGRAVYGRLGPNGRRAARRHTRPDRRL